MCDIIIIIIMTWPDLRGVVGAAEAEDPRQKVSARLLCPAFEGD